MAEKPRLHESLEPLVEAHARSVEELAPAESIREAVRSQVERSRQTVSGAPPPQAPQVPPHPTPHPKEGELKGMEESRQLSVLAHIALEEGIEPAVHLAERLGSPYVIDALHDFITDRLIDVARERRALKKR